MIPQISTSSLIPGVVPTGASSVTGTGSSLFSSGANTANTGSVLTSATLNSQNNGILGAIQSILEMVTMLLPQLLGGNTGLGQSTPSFDKSYASTATGGTANAGGAGGGTAIANNTADPQQSARLDGVLAKVAQDPEGSKLLAAAKEKGYTIEVGDPSAAAGGAGDGQVNGVTLSGNQKKIIISPNAPDFEKTVVHELVHAATDGDDNSQQEEGISDVIGYRVANRITGKAQPGDAQSIYQNKMANYQDLGQTNDVRNTLAALGIDAGI